MITKVVRKQGNSSKCFACGINNPTGFQARFYETDSKECVAVFKTQDLQQSFTGRTHGGVISAMLDETIGRSIWCIEDGAWAVTVELNIRYRVPVPLEAEMKCVGRVTRNTRKVFEGTGEVILEDGTVLCEAWGKFWKMSTAEIGFDDSSEAGEWFLLGSEEMDPLEFELPDGLAENNMFSSKKKKKG